MSDPMMHPTTEKLQGYVEDSLAAADRAILESHLNSCAVCNGEVEEWRSLFSVLKTLPQMEPSKDFVNRVMANVKLPDPWYVRAAARVRSELQVFVPRTTRGWAFATAMMAVPFLFFGGLFAWVLSHPFVTPQTVASFAADKSFKVIEGAASGTLANLLQSDVALLFARGLEALRNAGLGTAGALAAAIAIGIGVSAWVLYTNLFRKTTTRANDDYVSYCF